MTFAELAIISIAFGITLGYLIGIIKYSTIIIEPVDPGSPQAQSFRGLIRNKGEGEKTSSLIPRP